MAGGSKVIRLATITMFAGLTACTQFPSSANDVKHTPFNVALICVFDCVIEANQEALENDNGTLTGGTITENAEATGNLDTP